MPDNVDTNMNENKSGLNAVGKKRNNVTKWNTGFVWLYIVAFSRETKK